MMQTRILRKKLYQINRIDETNYSQVVFDRKEKLDKIGLLLAEGCSEEIAIQTFNLSRSTYYRWKKNYQLSGLQGLENESTKPFNTRKTTWTQKIEQQIYQLRKEFPLWGKAKITVMYERKYKESISESTVGRILKKLVAATKVMPVRFLYGKKDTKHRTFNGHAQRWKHGMKATKPGELIQVDHMTVHVPGFGKIKHFNAVCPITKYAVYHAYPTATSEHAAHFLKHMMANFPFPILSLQVDGGPEFMDKFELLAQQNDIPMWVLPPRSPECNGTVERGNGTAKYEFYYQYHAQPTMPIIQKNLQKFAVFYNSVRPHQGIDLLTPLSFYELISKEALQSHMS